MPEAPTSPSPDPLAELQRRVSHTFSSPGLLRQALTHRSYTVEHGDTSPDNELLEFLGDAVLDLVISRLLFDRYGGRLREGDLTKMRAGLVNEGRLAAAARELGLGALLRLGRGEERSGGRHKASILADAFEALVGALYLDGGLEAVFRFVRSSFGPLLEHAEEVGGLGDYKSALQEVTQRRYHEAPAYEVVEARGPDHAKHFVVALSLKGRRLATGEGASKKEAEQAAARKALEALEAAGGKDVPHG
ncbi:ribonuclease III [Dissulfurirhabdus thermomarina]|uniref:Ribonuclease 3 n=1 Tax=Dissulfurirhabdus thermomarina TaxID=1765737 RepID=A0A6N9TMT6_DISTH|nr:ribonuclease III [Dissulfurirhabdus thermomarina]NDY41750.1 ribonuclease III [Dissulfurirhabdus thermomarina]NMX24039.1 ribonuclease III [Dissulfurirhabdus thermomarina]